MSTHVPGFQPLFRFFALFGSGQISHQQHKGLYNLTENKCCDKNKNIDGK